MSGMRFFRNKDICVRLEGDSIKGANSFSFDSAYSAPKIEVIGRGSTRQYQGKNEAGGSISALILDDGSYLHNRFMSASGIITGGFVGATDNSTPERLTVGFNFNSGYISNYTLNGGVGSPPSDSIEFVVYGEVSGDNQPIDAQDNIGESGIKNKSIIIEGLDTLESQFIQSFTYSISTNWKPSYVMGRHLPIDVSRVEGYTVSLDLDIIAGTGNKQSVLNDFEETFVSGSSDLEIKFGDCREITGYRMPRARIESETLNSSVNGFLEGNIRFQTVINNLEELLPISS
tara:strand:+ start:6223 stop:7086 length:864 start_codon:yes stop_codon:yes gene_type:complete